MKISFNWLKDYIDLSVEPRQLADRLSLSGLEVEEVIERRFDFPGVVVGHVLQAENHPTASKLKICQVTIGEEELRIICGAPNIAAGQTVPVARVGASLPNGLKIHKSKIRGIASEGMICSEAELGLQEHSEGIWVLPEGLPPGVPLDKALHLENDYIFNIAVTPNRPDCLSHIGIAREVGALTNQRIRRPEISIPEIDEQTTDQIQIRIDTPTGCPRYSARIIRNIKVGASPAWLVKRLEAVGIRSINNVVDITNYLLMETGHPLHAFDYDLIQGQQIIVREAGEGETFVTLDDQQRQLKKGTVLICDAKVPVAIGGIMGGLHSEVSMNTRNVLLESAYFNPQSIQFSSRYLGLSTEASQRFERGADPAGNIYALNRATELIAQLCGGEVYRGVVDAYPRRIDERRVTLRVEQINTLLGTGLTRDEMKNILERIDLRVEGDEILIPTFRPDIGIVADLAEEIARLYGLDNIPPTPVFNIDYNVRINEFDLFVDRLKEILSGAGLQEVITSSMVNSELWEKVTGHHMLPLLNPISKDLDGLRHSLLPSLVQIIQYNLNRKASDLKLFEINRVFLPKGNGHSRPEEIHHLTITLTGKREGSLWYSSHQPHDFYDIKGIVEVLCHKISLDNWEFISYSDPVIQGSGIALKINDDIVGYMGQLSQVIAEGLGVESEVFFADLAVSKLFRYRKSEKKYQPIPRFPGIERDMALVMDESLEADHIIQLIRKQGGDLLKQVAIFDIYRGKQIPEGKKSLALNLTFQSHQRTLTEEEIGILMDKIYAAVQKTFQVKLRE